MKKITLALLTVLTAFSLSAQTLEEGRITSKISYPDFDNPGILAMLPKEMVTYFKGDKTCIEQPGAMGKTIIISDAKKKETKVYMPTGGAVITKSDAEVKSETARETEATVTVTTETKVIAGYTCKKATVKYKDGEEGEIWFCPELNRPASASWNKPYPSINGMVMEYTIVKKSQIGDITMVMTVTEVSKEAVDKTRFDAPPGKWKEMNMDEYLKSMGQ
jgi:hypothetical protein